VGGPVRNGATPHAHLAAYFHVRAYGSAGSVTRVRCHVVIESAWAFVANPVDITYTPTVIVGGVTIYTASIVHFHHTRTPPFVGWWGGDPQIYARHNHIYLQDSKAIPKYETLTPSETLLNSVRQTIVPMDNGDHTDYMDDPGYQNAIGPLPKWDATYAVTGDVRAYRWMLANGAGGAPYKIHHRDENTGRPVTIDSYPEAAYADASSSVPVIPTGATTNPHAEGSTASHQPSIGYLPYLLTGDFYYLEEMQFWSSFNLIWPGAVSRRGDAAYGQTSGAYGIFYNGAIRGQAWFIRSLAQVASITPDTHPLKSYFTTKLNNNIAYWTWQYPSGNSPDTNALGAMFSGEKANTNEYRGFFDHYMSFAIQHVVDLGYSNAVAFRNYKLKFTLGLMGLGPNDYCFQHGANYNLTIGPTNATYYSNWLQVYQATIAGGSANVCGTQAMATAMLVALNEMAGGQNVTDYRFASMQPAIAALADSGLSGGIEAWNRSLLSGIHPNYNDDPTWAIKPRNEIPSWYQALTTNQFYDFPSSTLNAVNHHPLLGREPVVTTYRIRIVFLQNARRAVFVRGGRVVRR